MIDGEGENMSEKPAGEQPGEDRTPDETKGSASEPSSEERDDDLSPEARAIQDDPSLNPDEDMLKDIRGG